MSKHLPEADRKAAILTAALSVCEKPNGWAKLTREQVARAADCSEALVSKHFGTMIAFRRQIMRAAISRENLAVLFQGVAASDVTALKAPKELRVQALRSFIQ